MKRSLNEILKDFPELKELSWDERGTKGYSAHPPDPCGCGKPGNCGSNNWIYIFAQALANRPKV